MDKLQTIKNPVEFQIKKDEIIQKHKCEYNYFLFNILTNEIIKKNVFKLFVRVIRHQKSLLN